MNKKIFFLISFLAVFGFFFGFNTPVAKAVTASELQAMIQQLQAQILALQQQLAQIGGTTETWCHDFNVNLKIGDSGTEVSALRGALTKEGFSGLEAMGGAYEFNETLASAVVGFQQKYASEILTPWGLKYGTGFVGATTRAKLNKLYGCGVVNLKTYKFTSEESFDYYSFQYPNNYQIKEILTYNNRPNGNLLIKEITGGEYDWLMEITLQTNVGGTNDANLDFKDFSISKIRASCAADGVSGSQVCTDVLSQIPFSNSDGLSGYQTKIKRIVTDSQGNLKEGGIRLVYSLDVSQRVKGNIRGVFISAIPTVEDSSAVGISLKQIANSFVFKAIATTVPSITVTSPNGGENWQTGNTVAIKWNTQGIGTGEKVYISLDKWTADGNSVFGGNIVSEVSATVETYSWTIPQNQEIGSHYKVTIGLLDNTPKGAGGTSDSSDNYFSIVSATTTTPSITVTSPNGGENINIDEKYNIKWEWTGDIPNVDINITDKSAGSSGLGWIIKNASNTGNYLWNVANTELYYGKIKPDNDFRIQITESGGNAWDISDNYFSIVATTTTTYSCSGSTVVKDNTSIKFCQLAGQTCSNGACVGDISCSNMTKTCDSGGNWVLLSCGGVNKGTYENCASQGMTCVNGECKQQATSLFKNMENQLADASRVISSLIEQIKDLIGR